MPKKKTHSEFLADLGRLNAHADDLEIESEYQGSKAPVDVRCLRCGHKWMTMPGTLLQGRGCPRCGEKQLRRKKTYTNEKFLEKLAKINPEAEPLMEYTKGSSYIDVRCKRCGTIWSSKGYNLLQGKGCPHCGAIRGARNNQGKTGVKTREQFSAELAEASPDIEVLGDYVNVHTKIKVRCHVCGHVWSAVPGALLRGHGCPRCARSGTSFMEQFLLYALRQALAGETVLSRDKTTIGMELDILIPSKRLAVEPGVWFLHKRNVKRDGEKRRRCHEADIRLVTIYDQFPQDMESPFDDDCLTYPFDLNSGDRSALRDLAIGLIKDAGGICEFSADDWARIEEIATEESRAQSPDQFVERLHAIHPNIEVVGKYVNVNTRVRVRCNVCGRVWDALPASLLAGDGCRTCGTKRAHDQLRKSQDDFIEQVREANPDIEVLGEYVSRHGKVHARCRVCGHEWDPVAASLLRGSNHKGWKGIHGKLKL